MRTLCESLTDRILRATRTTDMESCESVTTLTELLQCDPRLAQAMLHGPDKGNLLDLVFPDGRRMPFSRGLLCSCSTFFNDLLESTSAVSHMDVEDSLAGWLEVATQLYPVFPRKGFSWEGLHAAMPMIHKYNMSGLLEEARVYLSSHDCSSDAASPAFVLRWLHLAEDLQLDWLTHDILTILDTLGDAEAVQVLDAATELSCLQRPATWLRITQLLVSRLKGALGAKSSAPHCSHHYPLAPGSIYAGQQRAYECIAGYAPGLGY